MANNQRFDGELSNRDEENYENQQQELTNSID